MIAMYIYMYQEGRTALLVACWEGHYDIVCQLLLAGAKPNAQDQVCACVQVYAYHMTVVSLLSSNVGRSYPTDSSY